MAAATHPDGKLFTSDDGQPLSFVLSPCPIKGVIRRMVEAGGGELTSTSIPGSIRLTDKKDSSATGLVHVDFIYESVKQNELQDIEKFRVREKEPPGKTSKCGVKSGRSDFSCSEDQAIVDYIRKNARETGTGSIKGNYIWKEMEKKKVTNHTWQSMKCRFLKHLNNAAPKFNFNPLLVANYKGKNVPYAQIATGSSKASANNAVVVKDGGSNGGNTKETNALVDEIESDSDEESREVFVQPASKRQDANNQRKRQRSSHTSSSLTAASDNEDFPYRMAKSSKISKRNIDNDNRMSCSSKADKPSTSERVSCNERTKETLSCNIDSRKNTFDTERQKNLSKRKTWTKDSDEIEADPKREKRANLGMKFSEHNKRALDFIQSDKGLEMLKIIKLNSKIKNFMLRFRLNFMQAFKMIFFCNGDLEDAASCIQNQRMRNGSLPWNYEDDQILMLGENMKNRTKIEKLIKNRGIKAVKERLAFLG